MSRLKLYRPEGREAGERFGDPDPPIVPFRRHRNRAGRNRLVEATSRARTLHANSRCPVCRHPVIEPIELNDGARSRNNLPIPGTATLVGFRCERCESEWPA